MGVRTENKPAKVGVNDTPPAVRYMDKNAFQSAKKRVFNKHAVLLAKLAK